MAVKDYTVIIQSADGVISETVLKSISPSRLGQILKDLAEKGQAIELTKVDKMEGSSLMTQAQKDKLEGLVNYVHPASHPATMISQDSNNRFVSDAEKATYLDKYTKNEVDNKLSTLVTGLDWKEAVNTFADLATTYPSPDDGWSVYVKSEDITYTFNGTAWVTSSQGDIPLATTSTPGKMSAADKTKLDGIAVGATVNDTDSNLKNRANHTGTQLAETISDFSAAARSVVLSGLSLLSSAAITATDSILSALGKLQKQITDLSAVVNRDKGVSNVSTLVSIPTTKRLVYATVTAATTLSLSTDLEVGDELHIVVYNNSASAITQSLPNSASFTSLSGASINIPAAGRVEINILCIAATTYLIRAL